MSAIRTCLMCVLVLLGCSTAPAAAPPRGLIAGWVEDLASDDLDVRRQAVEQLWKAGQAAEAPLRAAMKHPDADVVLRARLILSRFDWGIFPDTPAAVVRTIERYRDGTPAQRKTVAEELLKLGQPGYIALQRLLARETDAAIRQHVADHLKRQYRVLFRDLLAGGDRAAAVALLEAAAATDSIEALRDQAAWWVLTGQAAEKARQLQRQAMNGDRKAARRCAYLHRANGDLSAARRLAEKAEDNALLAEVLGEQQDFKTLARVALPDAVNTPAQRAVVLYHAGDLAGYELALQRINEKDHMTRALVFFWTGRPWQAIEEERQAGNLSHACRLMARQGRRHDALALARTSATSTKDPQQRVWLLLTLARVHQQLGDKEQARKALGEAVQGFEKAVADKVKTSPAWPRDYQFDEALRTGVRLGQRKEVLDLLGRLLDRGQITDRERLPQVPRYLLNELSSRDGETLALWWSYLRRKSPDTLPSATLKRLLGWFEQGKADKDFDTLIAEAEKAKILSPSEQGNWPAALARACIAVGKAKKAEAILQAGAKVANTAAAHLRLADFYFERKRWKEAAASYEKAVQRERSNSLALYLHGVTLAKLGRGKEGQILVQQARLLPLADDHARYSLARELGLRGLADEAMAERQLMVRILPFRSASATNAASALASRAIKQRRWLEAARAYRRICLDLAMGGGAFLDALAYLEVPADVHRFQMQGLLARGDLDGALAEGKRFLQYLPEDIGPVIDLVRALDKAKRKAEADRLFESVYNRLLRACQGAPKSAERHNALAWLSARCGRQLERALRCARIATRVAPQSPGFLDTLAEVHFQRGEKEDAIAAMKQAVKLAPGQAYFGAALRRIEAGDRNAELPEQ